MIQYISIIIEAIIAFVGLLIVFQKKKIYGLGFFITFGIYVFYDLVRLNNYSLNETFLQILFFIASISILWSIIKIYKEIKK